MRAVMSVIGAAGFELATTYSRSLNTVVAIGGLAEAPSSYSNRFVLTTIAALDDPHGCHWRALTRQSILFARSLLAKAMDHSKSGLPDFEHFKCPSRINATCVVKPEGDA